MFGGGGSHTVVRDTCRIGARGADPVRPGDFNNVRCIRKTAVQGGDHFFVAADEAAYMHWRLWSFSDLGVIGDNRNYHGSRVWEAGSPRVVNPMDDYPYPNHGMHEEYRRRDRDDTDHRSNRSGCKGGSPRSIAVSHIGATARGGGGFSPTYFFIT